MSNFTRRPGDWDCEKCGDVVFASKNRCRCGSVATHRGSVRASMGGSTDGDSNVRADGGNTNRRRMRKKLGDWYCPNCGNLCFASKTECFRCQTTKPEGAGQFIRKPGDWDCPNCNEIVFARKAKCFKCDADRPEGLEAPPRRVSSAVRREGDWDCQCGEMNFASRQVCRHCQTARPAAAASAADSAAASAEATQLPVEVTISED